MRMRSNQPHANQKGVALLTALFAVVIISYLAVEISYEAGIEYRLSRNRIDEIKAHYAAKSGMELSLLRVAIYKQVSAQFGEQIQDPKLLDMIWNFPFAWPPVVGEEASLATREEIDSIKQDTLQDTQWLTEIRSESSKLDINDLNSPIESLRKAIREKLINMLKNRMDQEDAWADRNSNLKPEEIVNNITDYIDADSEAVEGGDESRLYQDVVPEGSDVTLPPNRDLKTIEELHMVAGVTDDIYDVIAPNVTVYGAKGINVNYADKDMIRAIDPQITEEMANEILNRRKDPEQGPFKNEEDFEGFIRGLGVNMGTFNESKLPLRFKKEFNFRITSTGVFGNRQKEITAIVYDVTNAKAEITKMIEDDIKNPNDTDGADGTNPNTPNAGQGQGRGQGQQPTPTPNPNDKNKKDSFDKGRPAILYWKEM